MSVMVWESPVFTGHIPRSMIHFTPWMLPLSPAKTPC